MALRLKEQGDRLGIAHGISQSLLESSGDLETLERGKEVFAKRFAAATG